MNVALHIPRLSEMAARQAWLSDPATMAYNRGRDLGGAEGYHPDTGCIDFPRENWRWWRQIWLNNAPDFYAAYLRNAETGEFVGEVSWYREEERFVAGILIAAPYRGRGLCAPALRALMEYAFRRGDVPSLHCDLSPDNAPALRGYAHAGFRPIGSAGGMIQLACTREEWAFIERSL